MSMMSGYRRHSLESWHCSSSFALPQVARYECLVTLGTSQMKPQSSPVPDIFTLLGHQLFDHLRGFSLCSWGTGILTTTGIGTPYPVR